MNLCEIIGLGKTNKDSTTYQTKSFYNYKILHDSEGNGITKPHTFTNYTLYLLFKNKYYSVNFSEYHCASYSGKLSRVCEMEILDSNSEEFESNTTHLPIKQIIVPYTFKGNNYHYPDISVCLHEDPNTMVFEFSSIGNCERVPFGYVRVNIDLFQKK